METKETEITEQDVKKGNELYLALREVLNGKDFEMSTLALVTALAKFLSDISDIAEQSGIDRETFMKFLVLATKKVDMLKESQKTGKNEQIK